MQFVAGQGSKQPAELQGGDLIGCKCLEGEELGGRGLLSLSTFPSSKEPFKSSSNQVVWPNCSFHREKPSPSHGSQVDEDCCCELAVYCLAVAGGRIPGCIHH